MKVKLKSKRDHADWIPWKSSEPFFVNPRGILVHRVRFIDTIVLHGKKSHYAVSYWCGNQRCFGFDEMNMLVSVPPKGRLVCQWCEMKATAAKEKSSDKIAGKHVHKGKCVAIRTCCETDRN